MRGLVVCWSQNCDVIWQFWQKHYFGGLEKNLVTHNLSNVGKPYNCQKWIKLELEINEIFFFFYNVA